MQVTFQSIEIDHIISRIILEKMAFTTETTEITRDKHFFSTSKGDLGENPCER